MRAPGYYYAVVTFGSPSIDRPLYRRNLRAAIEDARAAIGSGTCCAARVYACESIRLARSADISEIRSGEQVVW